MQNIVIANYLNGQIVSKTIAAKELPDSLIRDGWVKVHTTDAPKIDIVLEGGRVRKVYSDQPCLNIDYTDLDEAVNPSEENQRIAKRTAGLFSYNVIE